MKSKVYQNSLERVQFSCKTIKILVRGLEVERDTSANGKWNTAVGWDQYTQDVIIF